MAPTPLPYLWQYPAHWADMDPNGTALRFNTTTVTWSEFEALTDQLAQALIEKGIRKNDVIATMLPASIAYVMTLVAADKIGAILCAMDVKYRSADLAAIISHIEPALIVGLEPTGDDDTDALVRQVLKELSMEEQVLVENIQAHQVPFAGWTSSDSKTSAALAKAKAAQHPDDGMLIVFTGGTTGVPKAALLSKRNVAGMAAEEVRFLNRLLNESGIDSRSKTLAALPPSHVGGTVELFGSGIVGGGEIIIHETWSPSRVLQTIADESLPWVGGVPTMFALMLLSPEIKTCDLSSLKLVVMSGEKIEAELLEMVMSSICSRVVVGYGCTEGGAEVTFTQPGDDPKALCDGYVGKPLPGMTVRIADDDDRVLPAGSVGEVLTKGDFSIRQYYRMPEEDAAGFTADGFCRTGDLGFLDENGGLYIQGRKKHIIRVGSYTVMPSEIEEVVLQVPGVGMAAAVGVPDKVFGEKIWVVVSPSPDATLAETDIIDRCRQNLAKFKVPEKVIFKDQLPVTRIGKVHRVQLQEMIASQLVPIQK